MISANDDQPIYGGINQEINHGKSRENNPVSAYDMLEATI